MNPLFRIDFSISDSLKIVRKSVLIYETIIVWWCSLLEVRQEQPNKETVLVLTLVRTGTYSDLFDK